MWRSRSPEQASLLQRFSPELRLVVACASTKPDNARIEEALKSKLDWSRVVKIAVNHHVASLLFTNLNKSFASAVPKEAMNILQRNSQFIMHRNLFLVAELLRLLKQFAAEGITIPFKGPMLAAAVYKNMALRCCGDLDLLVKPEDAIRAKNILVAQGMQPDFPTSTAEEIRYLLAMNEQQEREYFRIHWEYHLVRKDGLNVDMHWRVMPPELALDFENEDLWRRLGTVPMGGQQVPNLSNEDLLLVLCANGTKDTWCRLDRLCDITELLRQHGTTLDWDYVLKTARSMGGYRLLLLGLALAQNLLDAPIPAAMRKRIARESGLRSLMAVIASRLALEQDDLEAIPTRVEAGFRLRVRERLSDRARYCISYITPSVGDWTTVQLPRSLAFLYVLMRPLRLLVKFGPMLRPRPSAMR